MKNTLNTESIRQMLNHSSAGLDQPVLAQLRDAREHALARFDARSTAPVFAWASVLHGSGNAGRSHRSHYHWAIAILLAACMFSAVTYWKHATEHEVSDVDIAILTDDLPIEMYVD